MEKNDIVVVTSIADAKKLDSGIQIGSAVSEKVLLMNVNETKATEEILKKNERTRKAEDDLAKSLADGSFFTKKSYSGYYAYGYYYAGSYGFFLVSNKKEPTEEEIMRIVNDNSPRIAPRKADTTTQQSEEVSQPNEENLESAFTYYIKKYKLLVIAALCAVGYLLYRKFTGK